MQTGSVAPIAAAAVVRKQKKIVAAFEHAGAISAATAVTLASLGIEEKRPLRILREHAVIRDAGNNRFYVDEPSWQVLRRMRHRIATIVSLLAVLLLFVIWTMSASSK